jgi:hypothetical protein
MRRASVACVELVGILLLLAVIMMLVTLAGV